MTGVSDVLRPSAGDALNAWAARVRANREQAPCESGKRQEDSALYRPDDGARAAASVILEGGAAAHLGGARERAEYDARLAGAAASRPPAWWSGFSAAAGR